MHLVGLISALPCMRFPTDCHSMCFPTCASPEILQFPICASPLTAMICASLVTLYVLPRKYVLLVPFYVLPQPVLRFPGGEVHKIAKLCAKKDRMIRDMSYVCTSTAKPVLCGRSVGWKLAFYGPVGKYLMAL